MRCKYNAARQQVCNGVFGKFYALCTILHQRQPEQPEQQQQQHMREHHHHLPLHVFFCCGGRRGAEIILQPLPTKAKISCFPERRTPPFLINCNLQHPPGLILQAWVQVLGEELKRERETKESRGRERPLRNEGVAGVHSGGVGRRYFVAEAIV